MTGWPQNAYVGQKIVCISGDWFEYDGRRAVVCAPSFNEVVTITRVTTWFDIVCINAEGYTHRMAALSFRPVKDTSAAVEELKHIALKPSIPVGEPVA